MIRTLLILSASLFLSQAALAQAPGNPMAPSPAQMKQAKEMMALMQEALKPLTQADVDNFVKAVDTYLKWVQSDPQRRATFAALPAPQKQAKIKELLGDKAGTMNNLLVLVGRVKMAQEVSKPNGRAEMKAKLTQAKTQMAQVEAQLAKMPPAMQTQIKSQMASGLKMLESAANYPDASIAIYKKNEAKVKAAMDRLEAEEQQTKPTK